jgi:hypothetical protein
MLFESGLGEMVIDRFNQDCSDSLNSIILGVFLLLNYIVKVSGGGF